MRLDSLKSQFLPAKSYINPRKILPKLPHKNSIQIMKNIIILLDNSKKYC
ncbi:hypothetical protein [Helicobacter sp. 23-1046]